MPVRPTFPGVYIEEIPSGVRPIAAVATSTAAFIGTFRKGLNNEAVQLLSIADFEREYGGLERSSEASYAVQQFFLNGGTEAWVVRIGQPENDEGLTPTTAATGTISDFDGTPVFNFVAGRRIRGESAKNPGDWGNNLRLEIEHNGTSPTSTFSLFVSEVAKSGNRSIVLRTEAFRNLTMTPDTANNAIEVVNQGSRLVQLNRDGLAALPVPPAPMILPAANGTVSQDLLLAVPGSIGNISVTLILGPPKTVSTGFPAALTITNAALVGFDEWRAEFEAAIRAVGANPAILPQHQQYFTTATVTLTGPPAGPHRFVITPGTGTLLDIAPQFVFSGTNAGTYGLNPPSSISPAGTESTDLPLVMPVDIDEIDTISISLQLVLQAPGTPAPLDIPAIPPTATDKFVFWAAGLQTALRKLSTSATILPEHRAYFSSATVNIIGDGTPGNPRRFVIRAGQGAQPYEPAAVFSFSGADAGNYGLLPPAFSGPQQFLPDPGTGQDGSIVDPATVPPAYLVLPEAFRGNPLPKTGLYALDDMDIVNIISMPDAPRLGAAGALSVYAEAIIYAERRRSMIIVDIPHDVVTIDQMRTWLGENESLRHPNSAVYYPRTLTPDPLNQNRQRPLASSGTIGGLWARTDTQRGVWKAPAGTDARLRNVESLTYVMTDLENGTLNPLGVNCLRNFPVYSNICWGARTLDGADALASDWKYVPVRRTTLFIEESLYRGTKWVVFEPNDEPLWAQIRLNVGAFMHDLFRKGAFQGTTPREAYFVKCDGETTTQTDIDNGIVNIEVGFAPLKPAEFVIIKIQQISRVTTE
ncbi:MAG: phage tail sheath family protein [Beijerinckiaceae bacterium]